MKYTVQIGMKEEKTFKTYNEATRYFAKAWNRGETYKFFKIDHRGIVTNY